VGVLCPQNQPNSPIVPDIVRNMFSFLVRNRLLNEALAFAPDMAKILENCKLETSVFKVLASVTVIQLAQGDAVKVRTTTHSHPGRWHLSPTNYFSPHSMCRPSRRTCRST